jgi:acetylornithine deacetylase/succinyl-diaminopimelate desuccinylase-like protein
VRFNIRYGEGAEKDDIVNKSAEKLRLCGFGEPNVSMCSVPHTLKSDDSRVVELLNVYKEFTGNEKAVSCVNAGGTYRQYLKNAVETGPTLRFGGVEGLINGHGGAHQPDEYINITGLLRAIELTLLMLLKCDGIML